MSAAPATVAQASRPSRIARLGGQITASVGALAAVIGVVSSGAGTNAAVGIASVVAVVSANVAVLAVAVDQVERWRRRRRRRDLDAKIEEYAGRLEGVSDEQVAESLFDATADDTGDVELRRQLVQRYLVDESVLSREIESQALGYMPQRPRGVKRAANHLRLQLALVVSRNVLGGTPPITTAHISKWIVLTYRWPFVAAAVVARPAVMAELEANCASGTVAKYLETAHLTAPRSNDLAEFCGTQPKLGDVIARIIGFGAPPGEPAAND